MQVHRIQSQNNNTAFKAQIIKNGSLDRALLYAENQVKKGNKSEAEAFYNSLRTIEKDTSTKEFLVNSNHKHWEPYIYVDGKRISTKTFNKTPVVIINTINDFVRAHYPQEAIADEAKNVNLAQAFRKWW